jgi:hypothetical protein
MTYKNFRRCVAEAFPLALICNAMFFVILSLDYVQKRDALVGVLALLFGAFLAVGIFLAPSWIRRG